MQWLMLQQEFSTDFVIATGVQISVREYIDKCTTQLDGDCSSGLVKVYMRSEEGVITTRLSSQLIQGILGLQKLIHY